MKYNIIILCLCALLVTGCTSQPPKSMPEQQPTAQELPANNLPKQPETPTPVATTPSSLQWIGTEPFWNFVASWTTLTWNQPNDDGTISSSSYTISLTNSWTTLLIAGTGISGTLTTQTCSDGMSENTYTHTANMIVGTGTFNGCATVKP